MADERWEVEEVTIDGDGSFRAGDTFDKTVAIIVSYHTFPSKNEEVTTDSAGHSETSTPLKITALRQRSGLRQANMPIV